MLERIHHRGRLCACGMWAKPNKSVISLSSRPFPCQLISLGFRMGADWSPPCPVVNWHRVPRSLSIRSVPVPLTNGCKTVDLEDEGWYIKSILKHISTLALRKKIIVMIYNVILLRFHCIMTLKLPPSRYLAAVDLKTIRDQKKEAGENS